MPSYHEMANEKSYIFEDGSLACFDFGNVLSVSADNSLLDQICIIIHNIRKPISIIITWNYSHVVARLRLHEWTKDWINENMNLIDDNQMLLYRLLESLFPLLLCGQTI